MSNIPAAPYFMNRCTVKLGADTFEEAFSSIRLVPTTPKATFKGLGGNAHKFAGTPEWVCNATFAQDMTSAVSLHKLLHTSAPGTELQLELVPVDGGDIVTCTIVTEPSDIGGDVDTVPTSSVALGVNGQPERTAPPVEP